MRSLLFSSTVFCLTILLAPQGKAQCDLVDENFDAVPVGTAINTLPGWRDRSSQNNVQIGTNPCDGTSAIVLEGSVRIAERRLNNLPTPEAFRIAFDVAIWSDGNLRMLCPNIFVGNQVIMDTRMLAFFEVSGGSNVVRSGNNTLPIVLGQCVPMTIDVDVLGLCRLTYGGSLLNEFPWNTSLSPGPCTAPGSFAVLSNGNGQGPGMILDNVCVSSSEWNRYCAANPNSSGSISKIGALGGSSIAGNDFVLHASDLPPQTFGFFLAGSAPGFVPNPGGSQGNLCIGGPIGRFQQILLSGGSGTVSMAVDWASIPWPIGGSTTVLPGQTWNFQFYHRDQIGGAPTSNFSEGLGMTLTL